MALVSWMGPPAKITRISVAAGVRPGPLKTGGEGPTGRPRAENRRTASSKLIGCGRRGEAVSEGALINRLG